MTSKRNGQITAGERLHRDLESLAQAIEFPRARNLAPRVRERILRQAEPVQRWDVTRVPRTLRFAGAALAILLAIAAALALTPTTREALARFFGLKRVQIIYEESIQATPTTTAPIRHSPTPAATPAESTPTLVPATPGRTLTGATTLREARERAPFPVLVPGYPEGLGEPDEVYLQELGTPDEIQVILRYPLFALYQFRTTGMFRKIVSGGTRLQEVSVRGTRGYWLEGALHVLEYRTADGREVVDFRQQVVGNTLGWEAGDLTYRIETSSPLEEALRIAESLR